MRFIMWSNNPAAISPVISGAAFPSETLTSTIAGQWYVNGNAVSGETGTTYLIRLDDIGYSINQMGSNTLTCWSPADISAVAGFWTPYRNVFNSVGPDVSATDGQTITRWTDIKNGIQLNSSSAPTFNLEGTHPYISFGSSSSNKMAFSNLTVFTSKTYGEIFWGGRITSNGSSAACYIVSYSNNNATSAYSRLGLQSKNSSTLGAYARSHPFDSSTAKVSPQGSLSLNTDIVLNARGEWATGGEVKISVDNGSAAGNTMSTTIPTPATSSASATIGMHPVNANSEARGQYRCICLVNNSLTETERSQIARYIGLFMGKDIPLV